MKVLKQFRTPSFLVVLYLFVLFLGTIPVNAQISIVEATIRISICGDGVAEKPEECDIDDYGSNTCTSFGYDGGDLTCNIDCSADTTQCYFDPEDEGNGNGNQNQNKNSNSNRSRNRNNSNIVRPSESQDLSAIEELVVNVIRSLPQKIAFYDINGDGELNLFEISDAAKLWYDMWVVKENTPTGCDVNGDRYCNLVDFSILMYYFN